MGITAPCTGNHQPKKDISMATPKRSQRKSSFKLPLNIDRRHYNSFLAGLLGLLVIVAGYMAAQAFAAVATP